MKYFRGSAKFRKIRKIGGNPAGNEIFGVTIPSDLAAKFSGIDFTCVASDSQIVLSSGCKRHG